MIDAKDIETLLENFEDKLVTDLNSITIEQWKEVYEVLGKSDYELCKEGF